MIRFATAFTYETQARHRRRRRRYRRGLCLLPGENRLERHCPRSWRLWQRLLPRQLRFRLAQPRSAARRARRDPANDPSPLRQKFAIFDQAAFRPGFVDVALALRPPLQPARHARFGNCHSVALEFLADTVRRTDGDGAFRLRMAAARHLVRVSNCCRLHTSRSWSRFAALRVRRHGDSPRGRGGSRFGADVEIRPGRRLSLSRRCPSAAGQADELLAEGADTTWRRTARKLRSPRFPRPR